ncbi:MAG TPA: EAL domain-containing protein, partial [Chromatiales bacterium]|nr:EAL domain-containing protein [Chromatiales bacterium]
ITRAIIAMGHHLGLEVVAEGVETPAQMKFLNQENCDYIQGYLLARPLPAEAFAAELRKRSTSRSRR